MFRHHFRWAALVGAAALVLSQSACSEQSAGVVQPSLDEQAGKNLSGVPSTLSVPLNLRTFAPAYVFTTTVNSQFLVGPYTANNNGAFGSFLSVGDVLVYCINLANSTTLGANWDVRVLSFADVPANLAALQKTLGLLTAAEIVQRLRQSVHLSQQYGNPGFGTVSLFAPTGPGNWDEIQFGMWSLFPNATAPTPSDPGAMALLLSASAVFANSSVSTAEWRVLVDARAWDNGTPPAQLNQTVIAQNSPASLGDFVWNDNNANGLQDPGEPGIPNALVTLTGPGGSRTATTGTDGKYDFTNLAPGSYTVCVTPLAGFTQTYDLDGVASANCATTTLVAGQSRTDVDFGFTTPPPAGVKCEEGIFEFFLRNIGIPGSPRITITDKDSRSSSEKVWFIGTATYNANTTVFPPMTGDILISATTRNVGKLGSNVFLYVGNEPLPRTKFHTACSQPLGPGTQNPNFTYTGLPTRDFLVTFSRDAKGTVQSINGHTVQDKLFPGKGEGIPVRP